MENAGAGILGCMLEIMSEHGFGRDVVFTVFAGEGGNGRDGRDLAAQLAGQGFECRVVHACDAGAYLSGQAGRKALPCEIYVDALLGTGLEGRISDGLVPLVSHINGSGAFVVSLDIPSGMPPEPSADNEDFDCMVRADATVALGFPKLSMLLPRYGDNAGRIAVVRMDPSEKFIPVIPGKYYYTDEAAYAATVRDEPALGRPRKFAHKGDNGHLLCVCGSAGMVGAAILAVGAALRSGCGLVTSRIPASERLAMYVSNPSAMVSCDSGDCFASLPDDMSKYTAVCVGCGLGTDESTVSALSSLFACGKPMVIDADALNLISMHGHLRRAVPEGSILTPHPGELRRLTGGWSCECEKLAKAAALASELSSVVVLKGAHTAVVSPDGRIFFNSTGCPGMAKGGSGDVLAGYVGGLLARGCAPLAAAITGVYRHGLAGEKAEGQFGWEAMSSADVMRCLQ